jgi:DNA-binding transcriptional MerR regulator
MKELAGATGVGRETIRYYIREGLLPAPDRPGRNVAWYDESFVERIALIKEMQRTRRLPLHVIKATVTAVRRPRSETNSLARIAGDIPSLVGEPVERLVDVASRLRLPASVLRELAATGAIPTRRRGRAEWLDAGGVEIVELWAKLHQAGYTEELGYGPQQLRRYVELAEELAREELSVFAREIPGRVSQERAVMMAEAGITYMNQIIAILRRATLLRYMAGDSAKPRRAAARFGNRARR